jgi:predicted transcriptional regulator
MKRTLIVLFLITGVLGFSQTTKKKVYKKPVKKVYKKKTTAAPKKVATVEPILEVPKEEAPRKIEIVKEVAPIEPEVKDYEITAQKVLKKSGWIKNRNSFYVRGIEGFVKGVYSGSGKVYVLIELANRTNISYDIESAVFITAPTKKADKEIEQEEKLFQPIWSNQPEALQKKETKKLVYAFDKFTIADNKKLLFVMNEVDGERTLTLEIKPDYIINAEFIK